MFSASVAGTKENVFGVLSGSNRWSAHLNWNGRAYFDPGYCCNSPRDFLNTTGVNNFKQYSFLRGSNTLTLRQQGAQKVSGSHTSGICTLSNNFGVLCKRF